MSENCIKIQTELMQTIEDAGILVEYSNIEAQNPEMPDLLDDTWQALERSFKKTVVLPQTGTKQKNTQPSMTQPPTTQLLLNLGDVDPPPAPDAATVGDLLRSPNNTAAELRSEMNQMMLNFTKVVQEQTEKSKAKNDQLEREVDARSRDIKEQNENIAKNFDRVRQDQHKIVDVLRDELEKINQGQIKAVQKLRDEFEETTNQLRQDQIRAETGNREVFTSIQTTLDKAIGKIENIHPQLDTRFNDQGRKVNEGLDEIAAKIRAMEDDRSKLVPPFRYVLLC